MASRLRSAGDGALPSIIIGEPVSSIDTVETIVERTGCVEELVWSGVEERAMPDGMSKGLATGSAVTA